MKAKIVNPFLDSVISVMNVMVHMEAVPGSPILKKNKVAKGDISGIIGMSSVVAAGSMAITFPKNLVFEISHRMLGDTHTEINNDIIDMVGELTNMVSGGAKNTFSESGINIDMATPVVICGEKHEIHHRAAGKSILLPFETEYGIFYVEVCFDQEV